MKIKAPFFLLLLTLNFSVHSLMAWEGEGAPPNANLAAPATTSRDSTTGAPELRGSFTSRSSVVTHGTSLSSATPQNSIQLPIEAGEYCEFLNALLPEEANSFYHGIFIGVENISHTANENPYQPLAGRVGERLEISQTAALHYCNWLENGSLSWLQNPDSTEYGTYNLKGRHGILSINNQASYFIPGRLSPIPDEGRVSILDVIVFDNTQNQQSRSIRKIPERSIASSRSTSSFSTANITSEWKTIQEQQEKWNTYFQKALIKKSKKSPEILNQAPGFKISLQQKITSFEKLLTTASNDIFRDQLEKLMEGYEILLDTVKHTHRLVEARVALSKEPFFSPAPKTQKELETALRWAKLSPKQRVNEFAIELQRTKAYINDTFQEADDAWKLNSSAWENFLDAVSEQKKCTRTMQQARVDMDTLKQTVDDGAATAEYLVNGLNRIGSILGKLDPRLALPVEGTTEATKLLIDGTQLLFSASISVYLSHLEKKETEVQNNINDALQKRDEASLRAKQLEKEARQRDKDHTMEKAVLAKIHSPISYTLTWELWKKRVEKSDAVRLILHQEWRQTIDSLKAKLPPIDQKLRELAPKLVTSSAALEQATHIRTAKEIEFYAILNPNNNTPLTPEMMDARHEALQTSYALWSDYQQDYSDILEKIEKIEFKKESLTKKTEHLEAFYQREIKRQEAFIKSDQLTLYAVWPDKMPPNVDLSQLELASAENPQHSQTAISRQLVLQFTFIKSTFAQLQSCWERFAEALSAHLKEEQDAPKTARKQAELFEKTNTTLCRQIKEIPHHESTNPFHRMAAATSHVAEVSKQLSSLLAVISKKINGTRLAGEETIENRLNLLKSTFKDKKDLVRGTNWIAEIEWANQIIEKLAELVTRLR